MGNILMYLNSLLYTCAPEGDRVDVRVVCCALTIQVCTVYSVQCTVYSVQCTVYSVQCSASCWSRRWLVVWLFITFFFTLYSHRRYTPYPLVFI